LQVSCNILAKKSTMVLLAAHIHLVHKSEASTEVSLQDRDEDALMLLTRAGALGAFDEIVRRHQSRALRIAGKYLGDRTLAADAAQNTFVELYRAVPRYVPQGRFQPFMVRILINQCRMLLRSQKYEARAREVTQSEPTTLEPPSIDRMLAEERRRSVERALSRLSGKLREVVTLRYTAELSYQEIADVLEVPLGTVKSRMHLAMQHLKERMDDGQ